MKIKFLLFFSNENVSDSFYLEYKALSLEQFVAEGSGVGWE